MSFHRKPKLQRLFITWFIWPVEAVFLYLLIGLLKLMPRRLASAAMGGLFRLVGPYTRWHKRSRSHLQFALPHLTSEEQDAALTDMWNNLGRTAGEYFHIKSYIDDEALQITGLSHIEAHKGGILMTGHFGNWEIIPLLMQLTGLGGGLIFRPMNNPLTSRIFTNRLSMGNIEIFEKGRAGAKGLVKTVAKGRLMLSLTDQTLREGDPIPFFGMDVQTATSHFKVAAKAGVPIYPVRVRRLKGDHHHLEIMAPIFIARDADAKQIFAHARAMNEMFADWIKETPGQWMWPHRRWGKKLAKGAHDSENA